MLNHLAFFAQLHIEWTMTNPPNAILEWRVRGWNVGGVKCLSVKFDGSQWMHFNFSTNWYEPICPQVVVPIKSSKFFPSIWPKAEISLYTDILQHYKLSRYNLYTHCCISHASGKPCQYPFDLYRLTSGVPINNSWAEHKTQKLGYWNLFLNEIPGILINMLKRQISKGQSS